MAKEDQSTSHADKLKFWLEEYRISSSRADQLSTLIWTLATALLSLNAGGLFFAGQAFLQAITEKPGQTVTPVSIISTVVLSEIVATVSIFILRWWGRVANRWNSYINVFYSRLREIESTLGLEMWSNRDIDILDKTMELSTPAGLPEKEQIRYEELRKNGVYQRYKRYSRESIGKLRGELTRGTAAAWLVLMLAEAILASYIILQLLQGQFNTLDTVGLVVMWLGFICVGWVYKSAQKSKEKGKA